MSEQLSTNWEDIARQMAELTWEPDQFHKDLLRLALEYGDHKWGSCAKFGEHGNIENDCSCGWGPIHYYLRQLEKRAG